jgi:hypothetical protein
MGNTANTVDFQVGKPLENRHWEEREGDGIIILR